MEDAKVRAMARAFSAAGFLEATAAKLEDGYASEYEDYYDYEEQVPVFLPTILAINGKSEVS